MGQKINPISLRLQKTNRGYDSCWYSDYHYGELFAFDLKVRNYLERVLKQVKYPEGRALITHFSKASKINLFAFNPSSSRQQKLEGFGFKGIKQGKVSTRDRSHQKTLRTVLIDQESASWQQFPSVARHTFVPYLAVQSVPQASAGQSNQDKTTCAKQVRTNPCTTLRVQDCRVGTVPRKGVLPLFALRNTFIPLYNLKVKRLKAACFALATGTQSATQEKASYSLKREVEGVRSVACEAKHTLWSQRAEGPTQSVLLSLGARKNTTPLLTGLGGLQRDCHRHGTGDGSPKASGFKESLYRPHVESVLDLQGGISARLVGFVVSTEKQSALFLAQEVAYLLEKRIPFRKIKDQISKELKDSKTVKGIRITCSGRVGGKSKKAQKAKMETFKQGQTSLHVFSSKIDFAQKSALTNFGLVGVKVWICFY